MQSLFRSIVGDESERLLSMDREKMGPWLGKDGSYTGDTGSGSPSAGNRAWRKLNQDGKIRHLERPRLTTIKGTFMR